MSNYFKSVSEIVREFPALHTFLSDAGNYFAHRPKTNVNIPKETLEEHIRLVDDYFIKLVEVHKLDPVIDKIISDIIGSDDSKAGNYLKHLFADTVIFHDFGKINERFQFDKMQNELFRSSVNSNSPIGSTHSALSAFIYLSKHLNEIAFEHKSNPILITTCIYLSYSIFKHHSRRFDDDSLYTTGFADFKAKFSFSEVKEFLSKYLLTFSYSINPKIIQLLGENDLLTNKKILNTENSFSLYALSRLNFSLLTASDYLATSEYMNSNKEYSAKITDFGTLSKERIEEIYRFVTTADWLNEAEGKENYNKVVFKKLENYEFQNPKIATGDNLNVLRTEMAIEVIRNIRLNADKNLFYIEAPTGGGKTNLSALAAIELLKIHQGKYNKVFYVFPFTTLITQTYKSLKETFCLQENEMVELHSNAGIKMNGEDDNYGNDQLNYINHLFVNYPFTFLSHIRFFDILKTNEKEANYLLHRMANSIVVIDELQSYNPQHWDKVIYFVKQFADKFNIKFILMSATLPKLDKLNVIKENVQDFVYLLPNAKTNYFNNPNFSGRVTFNFDYLDRKDLELSEISERLLAESKTYSEKDFGNAKPSGSVYTIIEFIFKKTASEFHEIIKQKHNGFFDEIFVLSGTILPHRRKEIINFLKNKNNRKKKILLITTQVVEAGVDIDMDLGFKDRSLIDSDEQLAGRINRNVNKQDCVLFLFNYNKEAIVYGKDKRLELTRKHIKPEQYIEILNNKDFDRLYDIVLNDRNDWNEKEMVENFNDYENAIKSLKFKSVHDGFKLIEQKNISCFIPLAIPITIDGSVEGEVFSKSELEFLRLCEVFPNDKNEIEGEEVFDIYLNLIHNKKEFIKQKTEEKILQGIMSKFVFSLFATHGMETRMNEFIGDPEKSEYGYKYIEHWNMFYSMNDGMNDRLFQNSNETQFL